MPTRRHFPPPLPLVTVSTSPLLFVSSALLDSTSGMLIEFHFPTPLVRFQDAFVTLNCVDGHASENAMVMKNEDWGNMRHESEECEQE